MSASAKSFSPFCHYCKKKGHTVASCFQRKRDQEKVVGFVQLDATAGVEKVINPGVNYSKYLSRASLGTVSDSSLRQVSVFRDTGAFCSLIRRAAVRQPEVTFTGQKAII